MEKIIRRLIDRVYPELAAGYHLPRFAAITAVRETPDKGNICDDYRPHFAVDAQILTEHGEPDSKWPLLKDLILPVHVGGNEMGRFSYPETGTWVEVGFAYGSPNRPFIRSIHPHGRSLPKVALGEQLWQHNPESFQRVDPDGHWETRTDGDIIQDSLRRLISAGELIEQLHKSTRTIDTDEAVEIGAKYTMKAHRGAEMLSGTRFDIGAGEDLNLTSKAKINAHADNDINVDSDATINVTADTDINQHAEAHQRYKSPLSWFGSDTESVLRLLSDLKQQVIDLCNILKDHTHPSVGACSQGSNIATIGDNVDGLKTRLDGITE